MSGEYVRPARGEGVRPVVLDLDWDAEWMQDSPVRLVFGWAMGRRVVDVMDLDDEPGPGDLKASGS
jgi:hypothetical protein